MAKNEKLCQAPNMECVLKYLENQQVHRLSQHKCKSHNHSREHPWDPSSLVTRLDSSVVTLNKEYYRDNLKDLTRFDNEPLNIERVRKINFVHSRIFKKSDMAPTNTIPVLLLVWRSVYG